MSKSDLSEILKEIKGLIPSSEEGLLSSLAHIQEKLSFKAPEERTVMWQEVQMILNHALDLQSTPPEDLLDWQLNLMRVWTGNPTLGG